MAQATDKLPEFKASNEEWESFAAIGGGLAVARLPLHWMDDLAALIHEKLSSDVASVATMCRVRQHNEDSFWGLFEKTDSSHRLIGFYAQLMLNEEGHAALVARQLSLKDPDPALLVGTGALPAAVYLWGTIAEGRAAVLRLYLAQELRRYAGLPHYATLVTEAGLKGGRKMGLRPVTPEDDRIGGLFRFRPDALGKPAAQEDAAPAIRIVAATTAEELEHARAIRAAVFMGEQRCPYEEEFDGNDFCASHFVGYVDGSPVATMRMRYFADWVKIERMAVLERFRRTPVKDALIAFVIEHARKKGFRLIYGQPQRRLLPFWEARGFSRLPRNVEFQFSDHDYVEICLELEPHAEPISIRNEPMVLNRPEGQWDRPGVLDRSAARPVTRPA